MKKFTKAAALLLAAIILTAVFASCGQSGGDASDTSGAPATEPVGTSEAVASGVKYSYNGITVTLPQTYMIDESASPVVLAYPPTYPTSADSIDFTYNEGAQSASFYSSETLDAYFEGLFEGYSGLTEFTIGDIDGTETLTFGYSFTSDGATVTRTQVDIFLENGTVVLSFSDASGKCASDFADIIASIKID